MDFFVLTALFDHKEIGRIKINHHVESCFETHDIRLDVQLKWILFSLLSKCKAHAKTCSGCNLFAWF